MLIHVNSSIMRWLFFAVACTMIACPKCGIAIDKNDRAEHLMCKGRPPPAKAQWCPLCTVAVHDTTEVRCL
uniref:Secreted protein n=1 Tax=Heterorhabditis bacteriophora TaxID=37862 RepID=A0A1I7X7S7_HETBA